MQLTTRQQQVLEFIEQRTQSDGLPPTRAEIVQHFGFASPNAAQCHLRALAQRGAIELKPGRARGIVLVRPQPESAKPGTLPIIGRVAAGSPLLAVENLEDELDIDIRHFHPSPDYALRVHGESMIGAGINDGDLLLVHRAPEASDGQIIVARINDEVTVKRFRRKARSILLEAENPANDPIHIGAADDFSIEGLGVGVIRRRIV